MAIKNYDELNSLELDTLREISSIGTGNAATALSDLLNREVRITLPEVRIMGYNEAIEWIGGAEAVTAGVLMGMGGQMSGVMLSVQKLEFINLVLDRPLPAVIILPCFALKANHLVLTELVNGRGSVGNKFILFCKHF